MADGNDFYWPYLYLTYVFLWSCIHSIRIQMNLKHVEELTKTFMMISNLKKNLWSPWFMLKNSAP